MKAVKILRFHLTVRMSSGLRTTRCGLLRLTVAWQQNPCFKPEERTQNLDGHRTAVVSHLSVIVLAILLSALLSWDPTQCVIWHLVSTKITCPGGRRTEVRSPS